MNNQKAKLTRFCVYALAGFVAAALVGWILFERQSNGTIPAIATQKTSPSTPHQEMTPDQAAPVALDHTSLSTLKQIAPSSHATSDQLSLFRRMDEILRDAPAQEKQTAARLAEFAMNRKTAVLRSLPRPDVESLAKYVAKQMPSSELADALRKTLGISTTVGRTAEEQVANVMSVYDNIAGTTPVPDLGAPIVITDNCTSDARVIGTTHDMPEGAKRVYAVFENAGTLRGLDNVFVVWRKPSDETMVYSTSEPLHADAAYNYVWLQVDDGWPAGSYQVELYNPQDNAVALAKRQFTVK